MELWLLRPRGELGCGNNPWDPWYDKAFGYVIRAETEAEARAMADQRAGDENDRRSGRRPWLNPEFSTCEPLLGSGEPDIILRDYRSA